MFKDSEFINREPKFSHNLHLVTPTKERFSQLLQKLQSIYVCVKCTPSFQTYFKIVGHTTNSVISGLKAIYEYFVILGQQIDQGLINKAVGDRLIQGVHKYLQLQKFQSLQLKNRAIYILEFQTKFSVCLQFFHTIKEHQRNITTQAKEKYLHVWKDIQLKEIGPKDVLQKKYDGVKKVLTLTTMAILSQQLTSSNIVKKVLFGLSYPRYYVDYATARLKSLIFYKQPTIQIAKAIWDIPQLGASKQFMKLAYQKIAFNEKIYIPFQDRQDDYPDIMKCSQESIKVRILHYKKLHLKHKPEKRRKFLFFSEPVKDKAQNYDEIDSVMIHMHGGGFIALSSRMSQSMTRRWANHLKIPVFSIDYRKPPSDPFPAASDDCLTVYKFIVNKIKFYMNINPKNIYLVGQSAGGNLACSLMGNILLKKLHPPKGIYLAYPALDLRVKFSPSKINAVTDPLLWPSMLLLCLNQYLGGQVENASNPIASPILLTEQFTGGQKGDVRFPLCWPYTVISVGQLDPLYDDSLVLMQKMKQSKIDCRCRVYKNISHGFLSIPFMISECEKTLIDSIQDLKQLIYHHKQTNLKKRKIHLSLLENQLENTIKKQEGQAIQYHNKYPQKIQENFK